MFEVKSIVAELDAVWVCNNVNAPPLIEAGKAVIADKDWLFA
jgi:hypothetical protein